MPFLLDEVAQSRVHLGLAYNPPQRLDIESRASSAQPIVLLLRRDHPLARRGGTATIDDLRAMPLALMPPAFGIGHVVRMLELAEGVPLRPALVTNSVAALKRIVMGENVITLIGEFAASREIAGGELTTMPIAHPLFQSAQARLLVKAGRPLAPGPLELLRWIEQRMPVFAASGEKKKARTRRTR